jgi:hypothetical protein
MHEKCEKFGIAVQTNIISKYYKTAFCDAITLKGKK